MTRWIDEIDRLVIEEGYNYHDAVNRVTDEYRAFKQREQEDEDKPWAKPT